MLANMVKLRYGDTPVFLEVASVIGQYSLPFVDRLLLVIFLADLEISQVTFQSFGSSSDLLLFGCRFGTSWVSEPTGLKLSDMSI